MNQLTAFGQTFTHKGPFPFDEYFLILIKQDEISEDIINQFAFSPVKKAFF